MTVITQKFTMESDNFAGYLCYPKRAHRGPAILIIHHNHGLTDELKWEAFEYAEMGFTVFIPNMYQLIGILGPILPGQGQDIQKVRTDPEFLAAIEKGWNYLLGRPEVDSKRVGVLSFCMGARLGVHFVAAHPRVRAFAAYYPSIKEEPETKVRPVHALKPVSQIKSSDAHRIRRQGQRVADRHAVQDLAGDAGERRAVRMAFLFGRLARLRRACIGRASAGAGTAHPPDHSRLLQARIGGRNRRDPRGCLSRGIRLYDVEPARIGNRHARGLERAGALTLLDASPAAPMMAWRTMAAKDFAEGVGSCA